MKNAFKKCLGIDSEIELAIEWLIAENEGDKLKLTIIELIERIERNEKI